MSSTQRVIKYCATAFAVLLAVGIITSIAGLAFSVISVVSGGEISIGGWNGKTIDVSESFEDVKSLDIDNATGTLNIKIGETFKVDAENVSEKFEAKVNSSGKLTISEKSKHGFLWFDFDGISSPNSKITVYLPADFVAKDVKIDTGAGNVTIEGLKSDTLLISAGAGNVKGSDMTAEEVKVDGGVGSVNLNHVNFNNVDFDCGVGSLNLDGYLSGKTEIDCGVGSVNLDITGKLDDYDLNIDSGVGTVRLNGKKVSGSYNKDNDALNSIEVDGGVGDVNIDFME